MLFPEAFDRAKLIGEKAFGLMVKYCVSPNPRNYTLLYLYTRGRSTDLCRAVDIMLENETGLTQKHLDELYEQFVCLDRQEDHVARTSLEMAHVLERVLESIDEAGDSTSNYGKQLQNFTGDIAHISDGEDLRNLVNDILVETRRMEQTNHTLQGKLNESSATIHELGKRLEDVKRESLTDTLTDIANRKCFDVRLEDGVEEANETAHPLCLIMVDIDHFKKFNDTYGHQMGDQVLKLIGAILKKSVKGQDTPARYGGEEFSVILPNTSLPDAVKLADQIRRTVAGRRVTKKSTGEELCQITLSMGIAEYRQGEPHAELVLRADEALYAAKRGGRNRVVSEEIFKELPAAG